MSYYMRFISVSETPITLSKLEQGLKQLDAAYSVADIDNGPPATGQLRYGAEAYAELELNQPGDDLFEEERQELTEFLEDARGKGKRLVRQTLQNAKTIVAVQVLFQERGTEETFAKLDPLWSWLFNNQQGLLQADGEGYYDSSELILEE